ncbi:tRNA (adenosine(37)-N6)-threonylcarbamoyltransferase complex ATPase subunit type 1 TsaE [Simkania negevensis]|uniref:tRNA threonylcarbamoyladenosine biosynthesis protein TsaE n=1 Tax=Simkania negevensis TaxID=83561 RepID=A0ABS3AS57_9BACT|nr:tRNA (adenosine(37)-N6)-threonylcarbamoyltransferase complex ATPase subunit type 1 TsaE [Simkania negevensis]
MDNHLRKTQTHSPEETLQLGANFASLVAPGSVLCFYGDLGAGKTTFIKGFIQRVTGGKNTKVTSPTFNYMNVYEGACSVFHFDLYRIQSEEEFCAMGFEDFFYAGGICCIEWSEHIANILPSNRVSITINHLAEEVREIVIDHTKPMYEQIIV